MNIGKINSIRRIFSNEERICAKLIKRNYEAADKFVKLNFDEFPKGSAQEQLYNARTMLGKIAKDNKIDLNFYPKQQTEGIWIDVSRKGNKSYICDILVDDANNFTVNTKKYAGSLVYKDKDNIDQCWPRIIMSEDNFLRTVYRKIEEAIKVLNNK